MKERSRLGRAFWGLQKWGAGRNKKPSKRLSLERKEALDTEGGVPVIKGVSKRIIVVRSPDPKIFEQAIFIIREDYAGQAGVSEKDVLRQARRAADDYLGGGATLPRRLLTRLRAPLYAVAGAAAAVLTFLTVNLIRL